MAENNQADILAQLNDINFTSEMTAEYSADSAILLKSIDQTLKNIAKSGGNMSAANARNSINQYGDIQSVFRDRNSTFRKSGSSGGFVDGIEDALMESILGDDYKDRLKNALNAFADEIGVNLKDVPQALGKEFGKKLINQFKNTDVGSKLFGKIDDLTNSTLDKAKSAYSEGVKRYTQTQSGKSTSSAASNLAKQSADTVTQNVVSSTMKDAALDSALEGTVDALSVAGTEAAGAGAALAGVESAAAAVAPELIAVVAALAILEYSMQPAIEGLKSFGSSIASAWDREQKSRDEYVKLAKKRLQSDIDTIIRTPFKILEDAANRVYEAWDNNIRKINQTQGYTTSDLQSLLGAYSTRLKSEGLESVIDSTGIITALTNILDQGLSGKIAEEFAYQATKLNAAVPTQDFFNYASVYSSIAANAVAAGKSQNEAISMANKQLESFASNVLYASRQIAGGFSTGLRDAQDLFEKSVKIAQAARIGEANQISGVLTSVSAIVGAVAPDLASGIVDSVYQAAVGGNSSNLVALRSLAGINASNTQFLRQLATNPQSVFSALFSKLSQMQNMSDAYMETSEGLAEIFGVNAEAFARVDFNYLAQAISQMNVNNSSLEENMRLLASGESTTTAEQMRMQQVNKYLMEEGLALVLNDEAGRQIQQHMWDEQIAQQIMEAEYAVNLQGAALEALQGIFHTVDNILTFINPLAWGKRIGNLVATAIEAELTDSEVRNVLNAGKVGSGNAKAFYQLTTRGVEHNLIAPLASLLGGSSVLSNAEYERKSAQLSVNLLTGVLGGISSGAYSQLIRAKELSELSSGGALAGSPNSLYRWGSVGKSVYGALAANSKGVPYQSTSTASKAANTVPTSNMNLERMMDTIADYAGKKNQEGYYYGYEDWAETAKKYGIADLSKALEGSGYTEQQIQQYFQDSTTQAGAYEEVARKIKEEQCWDTTISELPILDQQLVLSNEYFVENNDLLNNTNNLLTDIFNSLDSFRKKWVNYVYEHSVYNESYSFADVEKINKKVKKDESDTAIQMLANILTQNTTDLTDPQVQGNALLAEILKVIMVIMNQNNNKTTSDQLKDSLNALALGLTG